MSDNFEQIRQKRAMPVIKKSALSEFIITVNSIDKKIVGGEILHKMTGEKYAFVDLNDMMKIIQQKYDNMYYPQSQNKLRDWNNN